MVRNLHRCLLLIFSLLTFHANAQLSNNCSNAITVCNNQLAEQLDDGFGTQECPTGGCGCMLVGEKNTRWFRIVIATGGTLEFTIQPYNGSADYDFALWNQGPGGACPSGSALASPIRCNYAAPQSPTGIRGTGNGNSNLATGNLFSNSLNVSAGDVLYLLVDNWDGTSVGFRLDFFGGAPGSGTGTTATFSCASVNSCSSCADADCKTYRFDSPTAYSFAETAANGACHSNFGYANTQSSTVCGTFTVPAPFTTVEFPLNRGYEITATNGANTTTCLNSAVISYTVWDVCGVPIPPNPAGTGIYTGLNNSTTYKVCKTVTVSGANCYLSRICLPYWTMIPNDQQCGAIPLTVNAAPIEGSNAGATSGFNAGCTGYNDVWYSFVAPASGRVQINVQPDASSDVKLSLIGPMAGLTNGVNDCNKPCDQMTDIAGGCNDYAGAGGAERLFAFVIPGQTYFVWISGTAARRNANFTVQVTETITNTSIPTPGPQIVGAPDPIPSNDECINAIDLNPMCNPRAGTTIGATAVCNDPDPQYVAAITLENDVWYKWTAPLNNGNAQVTLEVTGVSCTQGAGAGALGIQFGIFRGSCNALIPVSNGTTTLTFTPIPGATYYFVIDGNAGAQCNFNINIRRPTITSQTCNSGSVCAGNPINASFSYSYTGSNPGFRWAYCKSNTWNTPCTIDLENPATYSIYNPAVGLPDPGCTPATYTFVGYILADNGATTIAPGYPRPQPISANCVRQTNPCTFNIYPNINNTITVQADGCRQIVTVNPGCAGAITVTGNTNQTVATGTVGGNFTAVNVNWAAPYNVGVPTSGNCQNRTIQTPINCPNTASNTCPGPTLVLGAPPLSTTTAGIAYSSAEDPNPLSYPWLTCNNYGKGVWFNFVAPASGNVDIRLTNVGSGDDYDPVIMLLDSRQWILSGGVYVPQSDVCSQCSDMNTAAKLAIQFIQCANAGGSNTNETLQARGLNPGETYYVLIDAYEFASSSNQNGAFSIQVVDAGGGPVRPVNDNCSGAIDISMNCSPFPANNIGATSHCSNDLLLSGASTENSVWYTYTPTFTGPHTILYRYANGYHCATIGAQPGVQFGIYTSSDNTCAGTFTALPGGQVSTGTVNGSVTVNLTAGQKYYIFIDGYGGNECSFEFQLYNNDLCCQANLGATIGNDVVLCFGDEATFGVSADPINFGTGALANPVIGWQFSTTQPTVINPFDPANSGKDFLVGDIDIVTPSSTTTSVIRDWQGNYNQIYGFGVLESPVNRPVTISGFPAGANTFNAATDTITVCVYVYMDNVDNMNMSLIAPDGSSYQLMNGQCGTLNGYYNVCFSNRGTSTNITSACPAANYAEVTGVYLPSGNWAGLNGEGINGTWTLRMSDNYADLQGIDFYGFNIEIKKPYTVPVPPVVGTNHGNLTILNNDPFKYGPQTFWLTPVTFIDYNASLGLLYTDSCYHFGTPVKVTLLERVTTPLYTPTCNAPGDGSNGISMTITSPTGGLPGLMLPPVTTNLSFSNTTPLNPIPDGNLTWSNRDITVSGFPVGATLTSSANIRVCVTFSPAHTWADDIDMQLIAPNGGTLSLTQDRGDNDNFNGTYCFSASGATTIPDLGYAGNIDVPNNADFLPDGNFANIVGSLLNGTWRLQIRDDAAGDVGGITGWTISLTHTTPSAPSNESFTYTGTGAAAGITFPSPPVGESEVSNPFTVLDGQAWGIQFVDNNGCRSSVSGTFEKPNIGNLLIDTTACDGDDIPYSVTLPPPLYSQYRITIDFDSYPQDINWVIYDGANNVVESGGGYSTTLGAVTYTTGLIDPNKGPYRFELFDGYGDGLGSGGGTATGGGSTTSNFILIQELFSGGSSTTLFNQTYAYCSPIYCVGPAASVFDNVNVNLGMPTGTFSSGVTTNLYAGTTCSGAPIVNGVIPNTNSTGVVNTNAAGVNGGSAYSIRYSFTDRYNCSTSLCRPFNVFPRVSINPTINCLANPPTINVNASCPSCNATYVAEFSYNNGVSWTTATSANFQEIYTFARVRNVLTGEVACEVSSIKLGDCPTVLPIELIYIKALPIENRYIEVSWATALEVNTNKFEVLRSLDGIHFTKIGEVRAAGNSNTTISYKYDDFDVQTGIVYYYQIRELDNDNNAYLTNIVHAKLDKDKFELISIYPNPMSDNTVLTMYTKDVIDVSLVVYNDIGQIMKNEIKTLKIGLNEWSINTEKWSKGVYYFIVTTSDKPITKQVIKLE